MTDKLKPCPFCGGEAEICHRTDPDAVVSYARCIKCGTTSVPFLVSQDAVRAWNTRHERTCRMTLKSDDCSEIYPVYWYVCSECGKTCEGDEDEPSYPICPNCGAKVVG